MFEEYTDNLKQIELFPTGKVFRLLYDNICNKFKIIANKFNNLEELRDAFSCDNPTSFFVKQYGYRAENKLYAINKFGYFSVGLVWEVFQWIKAVYGSLSVVAMSRNCLNFINDQLTPLKDYVKSHDNGDWTIANISDDSGRNNELKNQGRDPIVFRDYQENSIKRLLCVGYGKGLIEIPTAGGKSLILANFCWNLHKQYDRNLRYLLLVPNKQLVSQMYSDFIDYGYEPTKVTKFTAGLKKNEAYNPNAQVIIANRQYVFKHKDQIPKIDVLICDECVIGSTLITTIDGNKKIKDIKTDDLVLSYNEKEKIYEYKQVEKLHKNLKTTQSYDYFLKIELENGKTITVTPNHKIFTANRGYIRADELQFDDDLVIY